jgi:hypothetical protein
MQQGKITADVNELRAIQASEAALFLGEGCAGVTADVTVASAAVHNWPSPVKVKTYLRQLRQLLE